jgi:hypothetical protein
MVVVAILGILAAAAIPIVRAATRNASVAGTSFELYLRLQGLRPKALADQETLLAVVVDAPGNDGSECFTGFLDKCARVFILRRPTAAWTLAGFSPSTPGSEAEVVEYFHLGRGIRFALEKAGVAAPRPFDAVRTLDPAYVASCGGRNCMAVRFSPNGTVSGEGAGANPPRVRGIALPLGSDMATQSAGADARAVLVAFPSGIVKPFGL